MEKTDRKSIEHKIKLTHATKIPTLPPLSLSLAKKIASYLNEPKPKNIFSRVKLIYSLADAVVAQWESLSVCRKGCAWCCDIPVEIMPVEIKYIEKNTGLKRQMKEFNKKGHSVGYCPLLDKTTGFCSVYEYRPFNCRAFVAFDSPEYCKLGCEGQQVAHWVNGGPANGWGSKALLYLGMDLVSTDLKRPPTIEDKSLLDKRIRDIRCYF